MGRIARSYLLSSVVVGLIAVHPASADQPARVACNQQCSALVSAMSGDSGSTASFNRGQRRKVLSALSSLVTRCTVLCGLNVLSMDTLQAMTDFLAQRDQDDGMNQSSGRPKRGVPSQNSGSSRPEEQFLSPGPVPTGPSGVTGPTGPTGPTGSTGVPKAPLTPEDPWG
jgi:hypothetical protein